MFLSENLQEKWQPILEHSDLPEIKDNYKKAVTAVILENQEKALNEDRASLQEAAPLNATGSSAISNWDPILISLVRRSMPNLVAYDICGVQPMTGPTGLIFAMRSRYANQAGDETFFNEVNTAFSSVVSGANTFGQQHVENSGIPGASNTSPLTAVNTYNTGSGMSTAQAETLGTDGNTAFPEMAFSIEKLTVTAKTRALKAEYSMELAQDLKAIHGLDAQTELSNILSSEILAEINREVIRTINITAETGADLNTTTSGVFDLDTDSNGRWSVEKFKGLMFQL